MRLIAASLLAFTLAAGSAASAEEEVVTGPLPQVFDVAAMPLVALYRDEFEAAWAGDCSGLRLMAPYHPAQGVEIPPDTRPPAEIAVTVQMLDRGLCVDFDPVRATLYLERRYAGPPADLRFAADLAWRYWHGFGAERDRAEARRLFDIGLLGTVHLRGADSAYATHTPLGRPLPPYAAEAARFIQAQITDPDTRLGYARALALGGPGLLPAGHSEGIAMPEAAYELFFSFDSVEAHLEMARLSEQGVPYFDEPMQWTLNLWFAASCGNPEAISKLHDHFLTDRADPREAFVVVFWLLTRLKHPPELAAVAQPHEENPEFVARVLSVIDRRVSSEASGYQEKTAQAPREGSEAWAVTTLAKSVLDGTACTLEPQPE
jgi:hypothetical protein